MAGCGRQARLGRARCGSCNGAEHVDQWLVDADHIATYRAPQLVGEDKTQRVEEVIGQADRRGRLGSGDAPWTGVADASVDLSDDVNAHG